MKEKKKAKAGKKKGKMENTSQSATGGRLYMLRCCCILCNNIAHTEISGKLQSAT